MVEELNERQREAVEAGDGGCRSRKWEDAGYQLPRGALSARDGRGSA